MPHPKPTPLHTNRYVFLVPVVNTAMLCRHSFYMLHVLRRRIVICRANISTRSRELPRQRESGSCRRCKITYGPTGDCLRLLSAFCVSAIFICPTTHTTCVRRTFHVQGAVFVKLYLRNPNQLT